jgi:hypothetical protein
LRSGRPAKRCATGTANTVGAFRTAAETKTDDRNDLGSQNPPELDPMGSLVDDDFNAY